MLLKQCSKELDPVMLIDGVRGWLAYSISAADINLGDSIGEAAIACEKGRAFHCYRKTISIERFPNRGRDIGKITLACRVCNRHYPSTLLLNRKSYQISNDTIAHEGTDTYGSIICTCDGMAYARVDAPYLYF